MLFDIDGHIIDPTEDLPFKKMLGDPRHSHLTLDFLNALMSQLRRPRFIQIEIQNPYRVADFKGDKEIVLDIHALADESHQFQIEMQVEVRHNLPERLLDNWSRIYAQQVGRGQDYTTHRPLIAVWIVKESFDSCQECIRVFELKDQSDRILLDHQVLVVLDLHAWSTRLSTALAESTIVPGLAFWLDVWGSPESPLPDQTSSGPALLEEVKEIMKDLVRNKSEWFLYEARRKARMDRQIAERMARQEGLVTGKLEGKIEGKMETAEAMHEKGYSLAEIAEITGLDQAALYRLFGQES